MGQTLSEPITEKHTTTGIDDRLWFAATGMQGWRISMEDAHSTILHLNETGQDAPSSGQKRISFFGVFDGHGGQSVAKYAGTNLHMKIAKTEAFQTGEYEKAIKEGFLGLDDDLKQDPDYSDDPSGCTSVCAMITDDMRVLVGNAGDSRAVLSQNGEAIALSYDHKPVNQEESNRIRAAGGFVEFGRVNGNLALSRALGDFEFKNNPTLPPELQIVTANPDIMDHQLDSDSEFLILACDGIWDCLTNQEAVNFVREHVSQGLDISAVAEKMMDRCLAGDSEVGGVGCDNMTVIVVAILNGKTKEEWMQMIKDRYAAAQAATAAALANSANHTASPVSEGSPFELKHTLLSSPSDAGSDGADAEAQGGTANPGKSITDDVE